MKCAIMQPTYLPKSGYLNPFYFDKLLNKKSPINIKKGIPLNNLLLKKLKIKKVI